jgi:iron complex transport system substrate-binding protein
MRCARATCVAAYTALVLSGFISAATAAEKKTVVDSAGRRVEVPAKIARVFVAGGPEERAYIPSRYANLPTLGRLTGRGNTANVEVVLASRPDVIIDYGVINPTYVSLADRVQQQTGVPYLLFDGSLSQIPRSYIAAGDTLGVGERARELARYAERAPGRD